MYQEFYDRINLNTNLDNISKEICKKYNLDDYISDELILVGYEDFNYILNTTKGKYCVKIFNKERTNKDINNYIDRIDLASTLNINTPKIYRVKNNCLQISYLNSIGEASDEDKFWLEESENGLSFSDNNFWNSIIKNKD